MPEHPGHVLVIILFNGKWRIKVDPEWSRIVKARDREYISELLNDWERRIHADPDGLFAQACSLTVGPLVAWETGADLDRNSPLARRAQEFDELGTGSSRSPHDVS